MANQSTSNRVHLPDDIIPRLQARDEAAYRQLIELAFTPLVRFAHDFIGYYDHAEDIVQDVLVKIFEKGSDFNPGDSLAAYLFGSVRNRCLNAIRDRGVAEKYKPLITTESELAKENRSSDGPDLDGVIKTL